MQDEVDKLLAAYRAAIEDRVRQQILRHLAVDPMFELRNGVDMQIQQEREKLEKKLDEAEDRPNIEVIQSLLNWLPLLARQIKNQY